MKGLKLTLILSLSKDEGGAVPFKAIML